MQRKLWAASDGNGGYDIGEGDFTIASVRNLRREDGAKVARAYAQAFGHEPRETALLFKAAPAMLAALQSLLHQLEYMGAPEDHEDMKAARAAIALAIGAPTGEAASGER